MKKDLDLLLPQGALLCGGRYRIEKYLSSGGFGNTYLAVDTETNGLVAIKELFVKGMCGRDADAVGVTISLTENRRAFSAHQTKFRKEAQRLQHLSNEHIVKVHRQFDENGTSYYAMDYINGESLSARLKRTGKPMTETAVMSIFLQVLSALEAMHKENLWHLDLKPGNIMLDNSGNAILIDFGASKQTVDEDGNTLSTSSQMACTPGYAAMEQTEQNMSLFGPWTDLYALGATLYNLLTLQRPPTTSEILSGKGFALPENISGQLRDVIVKLMQPVWKNRPQSVAEVRAMLSDDTVVRGGGTKTPEPRPEPHKRYYGVIFVIIGVVLLLIGFGVWLYFDNYGTIIAIIIAAIAMQTLNIGVRICFDKRKESDAPVDTVSSDAALPLSEHVAPCNNHDYVDLGLSVKWATCNVGADSPDDYGDYYAWGEVETKSDYNWKTYKHCRGTETSMTKYCKDSKYGTVDNKTQLELHDDVAHVKWGGSWRMPTKTEQDELCKKCYWTWTTQNGVNGYKVTSKKNGNSIFLPAAGCRDDSNFGNAASNGYYWSSSYGASYTDDAFFLYFGSDNVCWDISFRYDGLSVRPVCP